MRKLVIISLVLLFITSSTCIAQVFEEGTPLSFQYDIGRDIDIYELDAQLNITQEELRTNIIEGDTIVAQDPRIGQLFNVDLDINHNGTWTQLENGDSIWRLQINSHSGRYMMLIFSEFYMPRGSSMFVYSSDRESVIGAFTDITNNSYNRLTTSPIKSNSILIEYNKPHYITEQPSLKVESVGLIGEAYERSIQTGFGQSGDCMINAMCPEYSDWCNQRRSVTFILRFDNGNYIKHCSGSLLTNERRDGKPLLLTAFHCLDLDKNNTLSEEEINNVHDWLFVFNYQSPNCSNPATEPSLQYSISGASFIKGSTIPVDYAILQLNQKPPKNYNAFYNGWSNDDDDITRTGKCIHHPAGDIKKISSWRKAIDLSNSYQSIRFTEGTALGGSSGAPFFNEQGYVIGQFRQGKANCSCDNPNVLNDFGRFDASWHYYGLDSILNPNKTSGSYIISMVGDETCKENWTFSNCNDLHTSANVTFLSTSTIGTRQYDGVYNASNQITASNTTIQSGTTVVFEAGNKIVLNTGFKAEAGSHFVAKIGTCLHGCNNGRTMELPNNELGMVIYDECNEDNTIEEKEADNNMKEPSENTLFVIYPNPSSGIINIELMGINPEEINSISITNSIGGKVYSSNVFAKEINLKNLNSGLYTISIRVENKVFSSNFTIL